MKKSSQSLRKRDAAPYANRRANGANGLPLEWPKHVSLEDVLGASQPDRNGDDAEPVDSIQADRLGYAGTFSLDLRLPRSEK